MSLILATANPRKILEATAIFNDFGIDFETEDPDIDEIQHLNPTEITTAKARAAWQKLQKPLVVHDSSWEIPTLNGFPGGYMKYMQRWFSTDDWLNLMKDKEDRQIILHERVGFYDGKTLKIFSYKFRGEFLHTPSDAGERSMEKLVRINGDRGTLAENFAKMERDNSRPKHCDQWCEFAGWYTKEYLKEAK